MQVAHIKRSLCLLMVCLLSMALTGCVIVHHDEVGQEETLSYAEQYARDIWESEFIPYLEENAVDIGTLLAAMREDPEQARAEYGSIAKGARNGEAFIVHGSGTVVTVDTESSSGSIAIDIDADGITDCALQIGPIVKTTALRDCVPFISFDQFSDQTEFAGVSRTLNNIGIECAVGERDLTQLEGTQVSFLGAYADQEQGQMQIIPVKLEDA